MKKFAALMAIGLLAGCQYPEVQRPMQAPTGSDTPQADVSGSEATATPPPATPDADDAAAPASEAPVPATPVPVDPAQPEQADLEQAAPEPVEATPAAEEPALAATPPAANPAPPPSDEADTRSTLSGRVELAGMRGDEVTAEEAFTQTVVYYHPEQAIPPATPGEFAINTKAKRFDPDVLAVPVGSTVTFPNDDRILHNVFSLSPIAEFDLGFYGFNEARGHVFNEPGLALIHCNVHQSMQAEVLVVDTPFFTKPDVEGRFEFTGVPAGGGTLYVWNPRSGETAVAIEDAMQARPRVAIELTRPRVEDHVNKFGESY